MVPGLLQVADYTRALYRVGLPSIDEVAIEERVEERHTRQQILAGGNAPEVEIAHPGLESNFTILTFAQAPTVIHTESLAGQIYVERPEDVERYQNAFEQLKKMALSPEDTANFIEKRP